MNKFIFISLLFLLLSSCGFPSEDIVIEDFKRALSKGTPQGLQFIDVSVTTGEGDSDNIYKHVRFNLVSEKDLTINGGWLSGTTIKQDQVLHGGEVVILYQHQKEKWLVVRHDVINLPQ